MADSEADIYEVLAEGMAEPRTGRLDRPRLPGPGLESETREETRRPDYLREQVLAAPGAVHARRSASAAGRRKWPARSGAARSRGSRARRRSRCGPRGSRSAHRGGRGGKLPEVTVNVVLVREPNPPEGDVPVEWLLLTSLPIDTVEQVRQVIEYYCMRWMVEVFFRMLKSGCRVEERRFETLDRLLPLPGGVLDRGVADACTSAGWGGACPEMSCEAVFEPAEWQSVYGWCRTKPPPSRRRSSEMVRMVAQLGGYVNRPRSDPPGPQTVWLGLQRMHDFALCWELFGPGAAKAG